MMFKAFLGMSALAVAGLQSAGTAQTSYSLSLAYADGTVAAPQSKSKTGPAVETTQVYLRLDGVQPGRYYTAVSDQVPDDVLSTDAIAQRFWEVTESGGNLTVTQVNPGSEPKEVKDNGTPNPLIPLTPFVYDTVSGIENCELKWWFVKEAFTVPNPSSIGSREVLSYFPNSNDGKPYYEYGYFRVSNYDPNTSIQQRRVEVCVFLDANRNGMRDNGEGPLAGIDVTATLGATELRGSSDANGELVFENLSSGDWTIAFQLSGSYTATTPMAYALEVGPCLAGKAFCFGLGPVVSTCAARTPGYWQSKHGLRFLETAMYDASTTMLDHLDSLHLRDQNNNDVTFAGGTVKERLSSYRSWIKRGNAKNMAYQLSRHLVAMKLNVLRGFVDPGCIVKDPRQASGVLSIAALIAEAEDLLENESTNRSKLEAVKNLLDAANNNLNWAL
jgi:hypothetical protein